LVATTANGGDGRFPRAPNSAPPWDNVLVFVSNHVLSGALVGHVLRRRPAAAFLVGMASHLALDAIPHWGCDIRQPGGPEKFLAVAKRDGVLGLGAVAALALAAPMPERSAVVAGMAGAVLLDLDKPMLHFFGRNPFPRAIRRFHERVQNESPEGMPNEVRFGLGFAAIDIACNVIARRPSSQP
jgi:hypothetical protein